jgi:hypothetical protein
MWKEVKWLILVGCSFLLLGFGFPKKGNSLKAIKLHNNHSCTCDYYDFGFRKCVEYILIYKEGRIKEYCGCASEGIYTLQLTEDEMLAGNNPWTNRVNLKVERSGNDVIFFNERFHIGRTNKDTIVTELNQDGDQWVLIGYIP